MTQRTNYLSASIVAIFEILIKLLLALAFALVISFIASSNVSAISRNGPDEADFTKSTGISSAESSAQNMMLVVDDTGAQIGASVVSIYLPIGPASWAITINDAETCGTFDAGSATTTYLLETYTPVDGVDFAGFARTSTGCTGPATITMNITAATVTASSGGGAPITFAGGQSFYRVKLRTSMSLNTGASNGYEVVAPSGGYVSFYSQSGNRFAVQDRAAETQPASPNNNNQPWRYTDYHLKFAPSCNITGPTNAVLRWYDDDWGPPTSLAIQRNLAAGEHYRMSVIERNSAGATTATWTLNSITGGVDGVQSDTFPLSNPRFTGDQEEGQATISVRPDHTYEWIWYHVRKANAVQFQLPFDSIYWLFDCGSFNYNPRILSSTPARNSTVYPGSTIRINADATNTGTTAGPLYDFGIYPPGGNRVYVTNNSISTGGTWIGTYLDVADWQNQTGIAAGGNTVDRFAQYTVDANAPPGTLLCFRARVNPDTPTNLTWQETAQPDWCFTVVAPPGWNYVPQTPTGNPPDSATGPKPGDVIAITGAVDNTLTGTGPNYNHQLEWQRSGGAWTDFYTATSSPGLAGSSAPRPVGPQNFTIPANATNGETFCFRTVVGGASPTGVQGLSAPTITTTVNGPRNSGTLCYTIYNLRFNMENPVIGPGPTSRFVSPGESVAPTFSTVNSGTGPTPPTASANRVRVEYSSNVHAPGSPNLSSTSNPANPIPAGGDHSFSGSGTIPSSATVGSQYCVSARALPQQGFSDGTGTSGVTATTQYCYIVTNAPYLKVYGNDSWAGFDFSNATSCTPGRGLVSSVNGSPANVGTSDEYAVFGIGNIDSFGTANSPLSHLMKFANTPTHGNYGANRCVADYYALLSPNSTSSPTSLNTLLTNATEGQFIFNSAQTTSGTNTFQKQLTVLVNGNLTINGDIRYQGGYSRSDVPILIFVVRGNILISPSVTQLDGVFIAIDNGANTGIIETCSTDSTIGDFDPLGAPANGSGACDEPLEVNGTFIAQNIYFKRTSGGINEAANGGSTVGQRCGQSLIETGSGNDERCAAEVFRFSPEAYLARPYFNIGQPANNLEILQLRDLPPVF